VRLMDAKQLRAALELLGSDAKHIALYTRSPVETARGVPRRRMPEDAAAAAQELFAVLRELDATGVRLIWVSNHGGRQLDHTQSTIEALPPIADAVAGRAEIVVDGGFNRGTDVIKALARGARVVAVGRTMLWGLAADGADGVARVCEIMRDELQINMGLCGRARIKDLSPDLIFRAD